ncbi:MAG: isochorismatase family protein [Thermoplasmata archaeon]|nr:isochorismatase family protein [Thermoplasmata archaeon]
MKDYILLVVDYQDKLFNKIANRELLTKRARLMIRFAREVGIPILWTEHYPKGLGHTVPEIAEVLEGVEIIEKRSFSCFGEEEFQRRIREVAEKNAEDGGLRWPNVIIMGIETHICIEQTAFDSAKMGYPTIVLADCVGSRNEVDHEVSLHRLRTLASGEGLYSRPLPIEITTSEALIYRLLRRGEGETFKRVLQILKEEGL